MASPKTIEYVAITMGEIQTCLRSEVSDKWFSATKAGIANGGDIADTLWHVRFLPTAKGGWIYELLNDGVPLVRCWLCVSDQVSESMWEAAREAAANACVTLAPPHSIPWLAAELLLDVIGYGLIDLAILKQAEDLEQCVAWTLIESQDGKT